jgi:hypothetical protein
VKPCFARERVYLTLLVIFHKDSATPRIIMTTLEILSIMLVSVSDVLIAYLDLVIQSSTEVKKRCCPRWKGLLGDV